LLLLLSAALFMVACVNPLDEDKEFGTVIINLSVNPTARWSGTAPSPNILPQVTHNVELRRNGRDIIASGTIPAGATQVTINQVSPGEVMIYVFATFKGWDFAEGASSDSVTVVAGEDAVAPAIIMQRMDSGVVLDIEKGSTLYCSVDQSFTISNYSKGPSVLNSWNITSPSAGTTGLTIATNPSATPPHTLNQDASITFTLSGPPHEATIEIDVGGAIYQIPVLP